MKSIWLRGYPVEEHEKRKQEVLRYTNAFDELKRVLQLYLMKKDAVRDYGDPGWASRQIAVNEYNQSLEDLIQLLTLTKDD